MALATTWKDVRRRERIAARVAHGIIEGSAIALSPVDPIAIAQTEAPALRVVGHDFGDQFDGQLEYHPRQGVFLLFYNTRYDAAAAEDHHPRTRFSVAHELGHFYLEPHRGYLLTGGRGHESRGEFEVDALVEREADAFAAALLLPERMLSRRVNAGELTTTLIRKVADDFRVSLTCATRRCVEISHFPCAMVAIRQGRLAARFHSESLVDGGCYPSAWRDLHSPTARHAWESFSSRGVAPLEGEGLVQHWFSTYGRNIDDVFVTEQYVAMPSIETLLVLLTLDEDDLGIHE